MDPLDALLEELGDVEEEELKPVEQLKSLCEPKEIDIFSIKDSTSNKSTSHGGDDTSMVERNGEDSDDEELYIHKRELTEQGQKLEGWLKKNSSTSGCNSTDAWKSKKKTILTGLSTSALKNDKTVCTGIVRFDKFQMSVRNPKISSQNFGMFTAGMKLEKLSELRIGASFKDAWCTMAVIVEKGITKKSANGNEYLIWKIHDLKDCQSQPVKLLMFGDAIKEHWKLTLGSVIALMSPQIADDSSASTSKKAASVTLKVAKSANIVEIGACAHFGTCKGIRQQDGQKCNNFVNTSLSEYCVYHVMSAARKLSANRGTFNAVTSGPNNGGRKGPAPNTPRPLPGRAGGLMVNSPTLGLRDTMRPSDCNSFVSPSANLKTTTKAEEKSALQDIINQRKTSFSARQILKLKEQKEEKANVEEVLEEFGMERKNNVELEEKREKHASFGDFLKKEDEKEKAKTVDLSVRRCSSSPSVSKLWGMTSSSKPMGAKDAQEHAARLRAIAIINKKRQEAKEGGLKRKIVNPEEMNDAKKAKTDGSSTSKMDEIKKMLARKSMHHSEADQEESDRLQKHLTSMEDREKVETFTTTCMAVKSVKVVTCNECKYTAQSASSFCIEKGHKLVKHDAEKRFFKCAGCKRRINCFELMPVRHCNNCNENKWIRVAMRDERKVLLETENLHLRGEERKHVNS